MTPCLRETLPKARALLSTLMARRGAQIRCVSLLILAFLLTVELTVLPLEARQAPDSNAPVRSCDAHQGPKQRKHTKKKKRRRDDKNAEETGACLELRSSALEIQEYLQAQVRDEEWTIGTEEANENSWIFSRGLNSAELMSYTKDETRPSGITWTGGNAVVRINTTELGDGYTRAMVSAGFRGYGESQDKLVLPREWWPVDSNGSLEASFIALLKSRFEGVPEQTHDSAEAPSSVNCQHP